MPTGTHTLKIAHPQPLKNVSIQPNVSQNATPSKQVLNIIYHESKDDFSSHNLNNEKLCSMKTF